MILECLQVAKPTCILSVPVLFNRVSVCVIYTVACIEPYRLQRAVVRCILLT